MDPISSATENFTQLSPLCVPPPGAIRVQEPSSLWTLERTSRKLYAVGDNLHVVARRKTKSKACPISVLHLTPVSDEPETAHADNLMDVSDIDGKFFFHSIHAHVGHEHPMPSGPDQNSVLKPAFEFHLIHKSKESVPSDVSKSAIVITLHFVHSDSPRVRQSEFLESYCENFQADVDREQKPTYTTKANFAQLFSELTPLWHNGANANVTKYTGSLTVKPFNHGISFYIFDRPIVIPTEQFERRRWHTVNNKRIFGEAAGPVDRQPPSFQRLQLALSQRLSKL